MIVRVRRVRVNPAWVDRAVTDRANRYRAWHPDVAPPLPIQCGFCGSLQNVVPHHIDGEEANVNPQNLMWACKSCNGRVGVLMRRAGVGRLTRQYNAGKVRGGSRKELLQEYAAAIKVMRGQFEGDVAKAVRTIRATPRDVRSAFTSRSWPVRRALYGPSGRGQGSLFGDEVPF